MGICECAGLTRFKRSRNSRLRGTRLRADTDFFDGSEPGKGWEYAIVRDRAVSGVAR